MPPEWINVIIETAGGLGTFVLLILRLRDSKFASDTKLAIYELKDDLGAKIDKLKDEINSRLQDYVLRSESDKMHAENKQTLAHIQSQLDSQGRDIGQIRVDLAKRPSKQR